MGDPPDTKARTDTEPTTPPAPQDELTDDQLDALDPADEIGGDAAAHPVFAFPDILVGPSTSRQFNTIEEWIRPVACWRLDDTRFEFDSSFVKPGAARELRLLQETREDHPGATLSLFGHADPAGQDDYNKVLSGRRARAIYGILLRDADLWEELFHGDPKCAGDKWGQSSLETMLTTVGRDPADAVRLNAKSAGDDRKDLYLAYMNLLCGPKLSLKSTDFLARGSDANLRGDVQGCGEFNAVRRFSAIENQQFQQAKKKAERDNENAPNRRVVAFLFAPTLVIVGKRWPCPAATQGIGACTKRLFVDHQKRRANQQNRREFATDKNTFECRFYHRLAVQSPCESSTLTVLQRLRVRLQLVYLDPMGAERPFPKGFPVTAVAKDGTARRSRVGDNGKVRMVVDRPPGGFSLQFDSNSRLYFASAAPGSGAAPQDKLLGNDGLDDAVKQGFRFFQVPEQWSTQNSDWVNVQSPLFANGSFQGIDDLAAELGTIDSPVKMVLNPHWQYLRWVYFDRSALKQVSCPPMIVEGFESASKPAAITDTRSNWTTDGNKNQCLPWIKRDRNRPDADVMVQLDSRPKRLFAQSGQALALTVDESGSPGTIKKSDVDTPSVNRLKLYDLPLLWKSRAYRAKLGAQADTFENLAAKGTSDAQPIIFSLDDVVLTDKNRKPIKWVPKDDRVAIFSNKIHQGIAAGLFRPDGSLKGVSQIPAVVADKNYLADYPDWVRLIVCRGNLHDVFDRRTDDSSDGVVGARAGVMWEDGGTRGGPGFVGGSVADAPPAGDRTMTAVAINFDQNHVPGQGTIGRMDQAILRCCDVDSGTEVGVNLHYLRLNFNFQPDSIPPGAQQAWVDTGMERLMKRWNGPDSDFNKGGVTLVPVDGGPLRIAVIWFAQSFPQPLTATFVNQETQYTVDVFKKIRASMGSSLGKGKLQANENVPDSSNSFTLAHESGHGDSMSDEYLESSFDCSYFQPGYRDYIPGGPYRADDGSMMQANLEVRNRHFWHAAEWVRTIYSQPLMVSYDGFKYSLPHHPQAPRQSFVTTPMAMKPNVRSGAGFYDCWLYALGKDKYSAKILSSGPFDGFLSVNVRMKLTFFDKKGAHETVHDDLRNYASKIVSAIQNRLNVKFFLTGSANGTAFTKVRFAFVPRLLVVNDSRDADYHNGLDNPNQPYDDSVASTETGFGPTHFNVNVTHSGASGFGANPGGAGNVTFNQKDLDLTDDFPRFFAAMVGAPLSDAALKIGANFLPIAQQVMPDAQIFKLPD